MNSLFDRAKQERLARAFHQLHHSDSLFVIPNAWDAVSTRLFEEAGFPAIASTSSGISWSLGYKDGEHTPPELMLTVLSRMAKNTRIPVSADIESGYYHQSLDELSTYIGRLIEGGIVGVNLEDTKDQPKGLNVVEQQILRIKRIKEVGEEKGVPLFINARTDAMDLDISLEEKIKIIKERAAAFKQAGADGVFVPFISDLDTVKKIKENVELPLNILMNENLPVNKLRALRVNRISLGSKPILASMHLLRNMSKELLESEKWPSIFTTDPNYPEVNSWF